MTRVAACFERYAAVASDNAVSPGGEGAGARRLLCSAEPMFFFPPLAPAAPRAKPVRVPDVIHSEPDELMCGVTS